MRTHRLYLSIIFFNYMGAVCRKEHVDLTFINFASRIKDIRNPFLTFTVLNEITHLFSEEHAADDCHRHDIICCAWRRLFRKTD